MSSLGPKMKRFQSWSEIFKDLRFISQKISRRVSCMKATVKQFAWLWTTWQIENWFDENLHFLSPVFTKLKKMEKTKYFVMMHLKMKSMKDHLFLIWILNQRKVQVRIWHLNLKIGSNILIALVTKITKTILKKEKSMEIFQNLQMNSSQEMIEPTMKMVGVGSRLRQWQLKPCMVSMKLWKQQTISWNLASIQKNGLKNVREQLQPYPFQFLINPKTIWKSSMIASARSCNIWTRFQSLQKAKFRWC